MVKLRELLTEKAALDQKYIGHLTKLTDTNNHTTARWHLADKVGDQRLIRAYKGLSNIEDVLRDASSTSQARGRLDKVLWKAVQKKFSNAKEILGAF